MHRFPLPLLLLAFLLGCCTPLPPGPPQPDAGDAGLADAAPSDDAVVQFCLAMHRLGCAEGGDACIPTMRHVLASRLTAIDVACGAKAGSKAEARACAGVVCP